MGQFNLSSAEFQTVELMSRRNGRTVHKLAHRPTGTLFALKTVPLDTDHPVLDAQFRRESNLLLELDHPNVVKCHDVVEDEKELEFKILMEFVEGGSLAGKHIPDHRELSAVARQILEGLAYLHGRGVPHWDIKPSNLLLSGHVVKIGDFGASRYMTTIRDHGDLMATVSYLSPERINADSSSSNDVNVRGPKEDHGFAGDIWGLGLTLLEAHAGKYPIVHNGKPGDCLSLMATICGPMPPIMPPTATAVFCDFIACCLKREPERRWTAAELLQHPFIVLHNGKTATAAAAPKSKDEWNAGSCCVI